MSSIDKVICNWLYKLNIPVSGTYIQEQLLSHPEYPSLLSITETLNDLGIENSAYMVEKDKLREIPVPFLAHINLEEGEFVLVENVDKLLKKYPDFYELWEGIALVVEGRKQQLNKAHERARVRDIENRNLIIMLIAGMVLFSLLSLINNFSVSAVLFLLCSLAGIGISILIIQQELGYSNMITDKLCGVNKKVNCQEILHSKGSVLFNSLHWSDIGIIYFSAQWLLLIIALLTGSNLLATFFPLISAAAIPFTFFSVYYQWNVNKWCVLCLMILSVLWIQFFLLLRGLLKIKSTFIEISEVVLTGFIFLLLAGGWLALIKPFFKRLKETQEKTLSFSRFKKNRELVMAVLEKQHVADNTPFKEDLQLSNPDAALQLTVASNPYCALCAAAHQALHSLIERYNDKIGLSLRFTVAQNSKDDTKTKAVEYILKQVLSNSANTPQKIEFTKQLIIDWFNHMDMEKFKKQYPLVTDINVDDLLQQHEAWTKQNNIEFTPGIFINGFQLPKPFTAFDLPEILFGLLNRTEA